MILSLDSVSYAYSGAAQRALNALSLAINSSRTTGLAGANGSGKTTLIKILLGQLVDATGNYTIDGSVVGNRTGDLLAAYGIGYAPDLPVLDEVLTGRELLELIAEIHDQDKGAVESATRLFRELLGLDDWFENKQCRDYSAGMRRKIAIAIAYLTAGRFAVLDEPTNDLDPLAVYGLKKLIAHYRGLGIGTLVSSHMLDFMEKTVDDIILLKHGECRYAGSLEALRSQYQKTVTLDEVYFSLFTDPSS